MKLVVCEKPTAQPDLHEIVREELHAAGPVPRVWLHERVRRRAGVDRDAVSAAVDELDRVGDLLSGHGLVGPAPLRVITLPGGGGLLVGTRPGRFLSVAPATGLPRRVREVPAEARQIALERWTGLENAPAADEAFLAAIETWDTEDDGEDWSSAYGWRDGRFRPDPATPGLWRLRMPGRWFRYAWVDERGRRKLRTDEGLRAAFALARAEGGTAAGLTRTGDYVMLKLPRLPRPEYRLVTACADGREDWIWRVPLRRWSVVEETLTSRLGIYFEETHGEA